MTAIIYASKNAGDGRTEITNGKNTVYIRVEFTNKDLDTALDMAVAQDDETIANSVECR